MSPKRGISIKFKQKNNSTLLSNYFKYLIHVLELLPGLENERQAC